VLCLTLTGLLAGCFGTPKGTNHFETSGKQGSVAVVANDLVILDLPTVEISRHGIVTISGTVHRKPGVSGELPGRVDIEFLDSEGQYLDGLPALLTPRAVPVDPNALATYTTNYGYMPPAGSTVRVHFVDRQTQIEEDLAGDNYGSGGAGGGKAQGYTGSHTTHSSGGGHGGGHGGGMGSHW